ncbi:hypothetical protein BOX15_Mlig005660g1 [Macrostomum lignano]|uniref:Uncharacterized protein n=1 Tax=Macrostomum lignano TaxID=282301 RepID=A0A267DF44_9PLAT|nr:hypothetical protein BOX15_Mlig005660g1 [Macrostomum lignano]
MASASQNESAARLNRHQSNSRVQEQQQLKSSSRSAVREARKEQKQQRQHQQKQDSAPQSDDAASAEETVVYFSFWVDERLAELLSTDPNVDRLLADIETTCGCSILVDHRYQKQAELQHQNLQQQQSKTGVSVPVEVLMNESGGDFPASARRLADLVCSLGGSWRVRRLVKRLPLATAAGQAGTGCCYQMVSGSNSNGSGRMPIPSSSGSSSSVSSSDSSGSGGSSSSSLVSSFTDERVNSARWSLNSTVSPFLRLRRLQLRLQLQQQQQQQPQARPQGPTSQLTRRLWQQAVRLLAEATRAAATEAAAGEFISFTEMETSFEEQPSAAAASNALCSNCSHEPRAANQAGPTLLLSAVVADAAKPTDDDDKNLALIDDSSFPTTYSSRGASGSASVNSSEFDVNNFDRAFRLISQGVTSTETDADLRSQDSTHSLPPSTSEEAFVAAHLHPLRPLHHAVQGVAASRISQQLRTDTSLEATAVCAAGKLAVGTAACLQQRSARESACLGKPLVGLDDGAAELDSRFEVSVCRPPLPGVARTESAASAGSSQQRQVSSIDHATQIGVCTACLTVCQRRLFESKKNSLIKSGATALRASALLEESALGLGSGAHDAAIAETGTACCAACSLCQADSTAASQTEQPAAVAACRLSTLKTPTSKRRRALETETTAACTVAGPSAEAAARCQQIPGIEESAAAVSTSRAVCGIAHEGRATSVQPLISGPAKLSSATSAVAASEMPSSMEASTRRLELDGCSAQQLRLASSSQARIQQTARPGPAQSSVLEEVALAGVHRQAGCARQFNEFEIGSDSSHRLCCHRQLVDDESTTALASKTAAKTNRRCGCSAELVEGVSLRVYRPAALETRTPACTLVLTRLPDTADRCRLATASKSGFEFGVQLRQPLLELHSHRPGGGGGSCEELLQLVTAVATDGGTGGGEAGLATETVVLTAGQCDECAVATGLLASVGGNGVGSGCRHARQESLACQVRQLQDGVLAEPASTRQSLARLVAGATAALQLSPAWPGRVWLSSELMTAACWAEARRHGPADEALEGEVRVRSELVWTSRKRHQLAPVML